MGVFPIWDEDSSTLSWELSLVYSSVINRDIFQFLKETWNTDDIILQDFFEQPQLVPLSRLVPSGNFRHNAQYHIQVQFTNEQQTFFNSDEIFFVPSKCRWMEIIDGGVQSGFKLYENSPGNSDISFEMEIF